VLVTDVVEIVANSPEVWYKNKHFAAHHISQKSVPKSRFLPASPQGEAFLIRKPAFSTIFNEVPQGTSLSFQSTL